jgi:PPP family 3-phenylpropionic acid transporter
MDSRFIKISSFFFFYFAIIGVWIIFLPKMLHNLNYSAFEIGVVLSIPPLMRFLTPFFFLKHLKLDTKTLRVTLIMMVASLPLLYMSIENFYRFAISNIFFGFAFGLVLPYIETYSLEVLQKERYGRARLFGSIGFTLVALVLAKIFDNQTGLNFIAVSVIATSLIAFFISLDRSHFHQNRSEEDRSFDIKKALYLWISIFLMQVGFGAFYSFFTIYENAHGVSLEDVSYLWSFGVFCEIVLFYFQEYIIKYDLLKLIKFSIFVTSVRWLILYLYPSSLFFVYISQSFHAFSFALYHTATLSLLYKIYKDKKLAAQFYYGFGYGLGGFAGSLVAGYFYGEYLFLSAAIITALALFSLYLLRLDMS